ncbi:MucR family transcriptional regulator [Komagataeibacter nataicola]|uniref:MucR family transcriptional regulator n=1 Tax=Komagataeibacter rhaeticus TaxID=215221 RepID=A0A858JGS0_9PROT|nr:MULTISPECIES: MucR family transcriptional regulator [Komagataeibacter]QIP36245.1 MucR family transcriptional regulator [Komagataeibacter rhaeticus]QOC46006.1 MucR family transcriptional regulator [Komagataeibacter rhaeticus]WEQ55796.1 MucR family transcriptional regulator [Komagataeibacter nataicola]
MIGDILSCEPDERAIVDDINHKNPDLLAAMTQIVAAHLANSNTSLPTENVPAFIREVYTTIRNVNTTGQSATGPVPPETPTAPTPAVPIGQSVFPDYIICLEDGKKLKMLKRHLMSRYQITPAQYREKWNLPKDYPMVAPAYAEHRSAVARAIGLGRRAEVTASQVAQDGVAGDTIPSASLEVEATPMPSPKGQGKSINNQVSKSAPGRPSKRKGRTDSAPQNRRGKSGTP